MRPLRFTTLQLLLAAALVALVLGLLTSAWRLHTYQEIEALCFSPSGKHLAAKYASGAVQVWRLDQSQPRLVGQAFGNPNLLGFEQSTIHFVAEEKLVKVENDFAQAAFATQVWSWDLRTGQATPTMQIVGTWAAPYSQVATPDRVMMVDLSGSNAEIQSYLLESKRFERKWTLPTQAVGSMILSADGKTLAVLDQNAQVQVIDVESDEAQPRSAVPGAGAVALSNDGRWLAAQAAAGGSGFQKIGLHDLKKPGRTAWLHTRLWGLVLLRFATNGKELIASDGRTVECYDVDSHRILGRVVLDEPQARAPAIFPAVRLTPWSGGQIAAAPDGRLLATVQGGQIALREMPSGKVKHVITSGWRLVHILIYTIGFAGWAAAWGIVGKRERLRRQAAQPKTFSPLGPQLADRPVPQVFPVNRHLATFGSLAAVVVGLAAITQILSSNGSLISLIFNAFSTSLGLIVVVIAMCVSCTWIGALVRGPHYLSLLRLRQLAADPGRLVRRGRLTLWFVGPSRIEADFARHVDEVLDNADELFGDDVEFQRRTLVACLDRQCDLDAFFGRHIPVAAIVPRMWTDRLALVCEETAAMALTPPSAYLRSALAWLILIERKRGFLPFWVATLASLALMRDEERPAQIRGAVRRLKLLLARQPDFDFASLFRRPLREQSRLWLTQNEPETWHIVHAEWDFLATLGDLLLGPHVSADRRQKVLAWLRTIRPKDDPLATFQRDVGLSLDVLLGQWREWLSAQSGVPYDPLPAKKRWLLAEVAAPVLRNRALAADIRWRMTRQLGQFYPAGAGLLIESLADPAFPFRREAIESLEYISGEFFGNNEARWQAWWAALPENVRSVAPVALAGLEFAVDPSLTAPAAGAHSASATQGQNLPDQQELQPPLELKLCWGLMVVGGIMGLVIPISLMFLTGPLLFFNAFFSLFVGTSAIARGAARDTIGLKRVTALQVANLIACDPVNLVLAAMERAALGRPQVEYYLSRANSGQV